MYPPDGYRSFGPVRGLIYGTHDGMEMRQINQHAKIKIGDRVISSGLGGLYPKGILIGWVSEVRYQQHELFKTAILESAVDFNSIEEVFVIIPSKSNSDVAVEIAKSSNSKWQKDFIKK